MRKPNSYFLSQFLTLKIKTKPVFGAIVCTPALLTPELLIKINEILDCRLGKSRL